MTPIYTAQHEALDSVKRRVQAAYKAHNDESMKAAFDIALLMIENVDMRCFFQDRRRTE